MEENDIINHVREIANLAKEAVNPKITAIECDDGKGGKYPVHVAITQEGDGQLVRSLLDTQIEAEGHARSMRLLKAAGPDRRMGVARHQTLTSFIDHTNRFKSKDSAVWGDMTARAVISVLDYHPEGATAPAAWMNHRGVYPCPMSEGWTYWGAGKAVTLDQEAFASLLDSRDFELAGGKFESGKSAPDPSYLVSMAGNLEVYSKATAKRERDPNTGRLRISYNEEKGVSGDIVPPPSFLIAIPVFQDGKKQPLEVRLTVDVVDGHARFTFKIHRAGDIVREAFQEICGEVADATTLPVFTGNPEAV